MNRPLYEERDFCRSSKFDVKGLWYFLSVYEHNIHIFKTKCFQLD